MLTLGNDTSKSENSRPQVRSGVQLSVVAGSETTDSWLYLPLSSEPPLAARKSIAIACRPLSHEEVSGKNDEAAHCKRGVDADHDPGESPLEEMRRKQSAADQCSQRNQYSGHQTEGSGACSQPPRRPAQRQQETTEAGDGENPMQPGEPPGRGRGTVRAETQNRERRAQQHGRPEDKESGDQHDKENWVLAALPR
jgi:hypothetical protein